PPTTPLAPYISTLSLHDALPIWSYKPTSLGDGSSHSVSALPSAAPRLLRNTVPKLQSDPTITVQIRIRADTQPQFSVVVELRSEDRKSTRLNSSHVSISYAVFCL